MTRIKRYLFTECPEHDTCWDINTSTDNFIYIGICCEHKSGGIAELVQFNPKTEELRYIADMTAITGEKYGDTHAPQGKIHLSLYMPRTKWCYIWLNTLYNAPLDG